MKISKASKELFLTQPAISKHIRRLEENLNIQLFERNGKTIALTSAGHNFLPHAKEIPKNMKRVRRF